MATEKQFSLKRIHHVAYRCIDAKQTIEFYQKNLHMDLVLAIAEDKVPSTKQPDPYMHIFLDAGMGNVLAFFELPNSPQMSKDKNTPDWVQHIAFELASMEELNIAKLNLENAGINVLGPTDHTIFKSIYFFDPNGHRIELAVNTHTSEMMEKLQKVAAPMIEEWSLTKKAPQHAKWLHDGGGFQGSK